MRSFELPGKLAAPVLAPMIFAITILLASILPSYAETPAKTVEFPSEDGLTITGEVYRPSGLATTVIVLFHQAGSSRGEYRDIAPELVKLGYMVLAIDQRAGETFGGVANETNQEAVMADKKTGYKDAIPDMKAAVGYARKDMRAKRVAVWGSSYSASLVLVLAGQDKGFADAVLSFSPGEYFKGNPGVGTAAKSIKVPTFITSARKEITKWKPIFDVIPEGVEAVGFIPRVIGRHGSSALLPVKAVKTQPYWEEVKEFLKAHVPVLDKPKVKVNN